MDYKSLFVLDPEPAGVVWRTLHRVNTSLKFSPLSVLDTVKLKKPQTRSPGQVTQDAARSKAT